MQSKQHWEDVYTANPSDRVSWYQPHAAQSMRMIRAARVPPSGEIIDVGGGASTLVDDLLDAGYRAITVLDLSGAALATAKARLGPRAGAVRWIEDDVTRAALAPCRYDLWHDRAVFHFLTDPADRLAYRSQVLRAVKPGGHVIMATFAEDGPDECSGLPVMRYSPGTLHAEFGAAFELVEHHREEHHAPNDRRQAFVYCCCRRLEQRVS